MFNNNFSSIDISASGLTAERHRMETIANNIANASSTRSADDGGPYRRQQVIFGEAQQSSLFGNDLNGMQGVSIQGISEDMSELTFVHNPNHPDADKETGMLAMPNVKIPFEMVDMMAASRSYEANLRSIKSFRDMAEQTLTLLRGNG